LKKKISITIDENTLHDIDSMIDNIYIRNRSQAIEYLVKNQLGGSKTAVILAGGPSETQRIGQDYRPTINVSGTPVVERAMKKLKKNGFKEIYIVARHNILTKIFEILKEGSLFGVKVHYVEEESAKGSADSLKLLKGKIKSNFLVVFGDIIFDKINIEELWKQHIKQSPVATLILTTSGTPERKGIVKMEGSKILDFVQKPKKSDVYLGFSSMFISGPEIFEYPGKSLEEDVFPALAKKGLLQGHLSSEKEIHIHTKADSMKKL